MTDTPGLAGFRSRYEKDHNEWWRLESGHHQNLFEEACDEIDRLRAENEQWREERHEYEQLTGRMAYLLTATANMLKGEPESHVLHDWSDLPDVAAAVKRSATRDDDDGDPGPIGTERVD